MTKEEERGGERGKKGEMSEWAERGRVREESD